MGIEVTTRYILAQLGHALNCAVSFAVFFLLDIFDAFLCAVYKILDYSIESECKPCYCFSSPKIDEVSDTLYSRRSLVSKLIARKSENNAMILAVLGVLKNQINCKRACTAPRWSDCDCKTCNSWSSSSDGRHLFVHVEGPKDGKAKNNVVFIHGFASSSAFWTKTIFPEFKEKTRTSYRLFALDLLGFGRSPKPSESLYTLEEHIAMIEQSLETYKVGSFHIVAHSLGSILAVALAARHPEAVKSLTLVAPPYFPSENGRERTEAVMRQLAPRRVWPLFMFGVSLGVQYEHISRTICLLICKNHRLWELIFKRLTLNRMKTYLMENFFCHTHNAAWHTLHNIICGSGSKMDHDLDVLREKVKCDMHLFHGRDDMLIPMNCSYAIGSKVSSASVNIIDDKDHLSIVLNRRIDFAIQLEEIWENVR